LNFAPFLAYLAPKFAIVAKTITKEFVLQKLDSGLKNAEFDADFESVEKVAKNFTKKLESRELAHTKL
jgi:hypothetical protein